MKELWLRASIMLFSLKWCWKDSYNHILHYSRLFYFNFYSILIFIQFSFFYISRLSQRSHSYSKISSTSKSLAIKTLNDFENKVWSKLDDFTNQLTQILKSSLLISSQLNILQENIVSAKSSIANEAKILHESVYKIKNNESGSDNSQGE